MDFDLEKKLAMIGGQSSEQYDLRQLTAGDRQQILNALDVLFSGLSLSNWLSGGTLWDAWGKSLDSIRNMVYGIDKVNPAVLYLRIAMAEHRENQSAMMLGSRSSGEYVQCPPDKRTEWQRHADLQIKEGMEVIKQKIEEFALPKSDVKTEPGNSSVLTRQNVRSEREHGERTRS